MPFTYIKITLLLFLFSFTLEGQSNQEDWVSYDGLYENDKPGSTQVRTDLIQNLPTEEFPLILVTGVSYYCDKSNGLPEMNLMDLLLDVTQKTKAFLNEKCENIYVGCFMYDEKRLHYFYLKSSKGIAKKLEKFYKKRFPDDNYYINISNDNDWSYYQKFLYPNTATLKFLADKKKVNLIRSKCTSESIVRKITHDLSFKDEKSKELFTAEAKSKGFKILSSKTIKENEAFTLKIWREDACNIETVYALRSLLEKLSKKYNGIYENWEAPEVK